MNPAAQTFLQYFLHPFTRYVLSWLLVVTITVTQVGIALIAFDSPKRRDGNLGHTTIDFGGQWLMGRMVAKGLVQHLYHRNYQREVLHEAYPRLWHTRKEVFVRLFLFASTR